MRDIAAHREEVSSLSFDAAREKAYSLIQDSERYRTVCSAPTDEEREAISQLPPGACMLFERYSRIECSRSDTKYIREEVGPADYRLGFLRIGRALDATERVVRPGQEFVFEIDGSEESDDVLEGLPSVYHWIVFENWLTLGD